MSIKGNIADVYKVTVYCETDYNSPDRDVKVVYDAYITSDYLLADEDYKKQIDDIKVNVINLNDGHPVVELITFGVGSLKSILKLYKSIPGYYFNGSTLHTFLPRNDKEIRYDVHIGPKSGLDLMRFKGETAKADAYEENDPIFVGEVTNAMTITTYNCK